MERDMETQQYTPGDVQADEDVASAWARLILECADEHGAPNFAWHMAEHGCRPSVAREFAKRWHDEDYEPRTFADVLRLFADELAEVLDGKDSGWAR
jgi:hypothetical protein